MNLQPGADLIVYEFQLPESVQKLTRDRVVPTIFWVYVRQLQPSQVPYNQPSTASIAIHLVRNRRDIGQQRVQIQKVQIALQHSENSRLHYSRFVHEHRGSVISPTPQFAVNYGSSGKDAIAVLNCFVRLAQAKGQIFNQPRNMYHALFIAERNNIQSTLPRSRQSAFNDTADAAPQYCAPYLCN